MNVCTSILTVAFISTVLFFRTAVKLTPSIGIKITAHIRAKAIKPKEKAAVNHGSNHREYS